MFSFNKRKKVGVETIHDVEIGKEDEPVKIKKGRLTTSGTVSYIVCRQWQVLHGNYKFLWNGHLMFGPNPGCCIFWLFIILHLIATLTIFLVYDIGPSTRPDKIDSYIVIVYIPFITILLTIFSIWNIFQIVFGDPGYIPRPTAEEHFDNFTNYQMDLQVETLEEKSIANIFCEKCHRLQPQSSQHCNACGICIEERNHHCYIFNTCIGKRNYGAFLRFIFLATFLLVLVSTISLINLITYWRESGFTNAMAKSPTVFVVLISILMPPLGLFIILGECFRNAYLILKDWIFYKFNNKIYPEEKQNANTKLIVRTGNIYKSIISSPPKSQISPHSCVKATAIPRNIEGLQEQERRENLTLYSSCDDEIDKKVTTVSKKEKFSFRVPTCGLPQLPRCGLPLLPKCGLPRLPTCGLPRLPPQRDAGLGPASNEIS